MNFFDYMGYLWLIIAISFLFLELATPGLFFFVSFALGSLCAAGLAFLGYSFTVQAVIWLLISLLLFFVLRKYLQLSNRSEVMYASGQTNIDALSGMVGVVVQAITPQKKGLVKVGGELWRASAHKKEVLEKGCWVKVLGVQGNSLVVTETKMISQ